MSISFLGGRKVRVQVIAEVSTMMTTTMMVKSHQPITHNYDGHRGQVDIEADLEFGAWF